MSEFRDGRVVAMGALGLAACCALPTLVGSGVVAFLAGVASGSSLPVVVFLALAGLAGFRRWHRRTPRCAPPAGRAGRAPVEEEKKQEERGRAQSR